MALSSAIPAMAAEPLLLADPAVPLAQAWTHQRFVGATDYTFTRRDDVPAIRAVGRNSASGLYRQVSWRIADHPWLEWRWRVDQLQRSADIRVKEHEDFAAAIFVIFGRPSMLNKDVPTLAYVWTSERLQEGTIVDNPRHPATLRAIVVRSAAGNLGRWLSERRNVVDDFRRAFQRDPPQVAQFIALFTDNDQTGEPVEAYYGTIRALRD